MNTVSVVIPWGKVAGNVKKSIRSALDQTWRVDQILVMANGAVSVADMDELRDSIDDIRVGIYAMPGCKNANIARNYGAALAESTWIAYLDSDDWWDQDHLRESIDQLIDTGSDFIYSGMKVFSADGSARELIAEDFRKSGGIENYLLKYLPAPTPSIVVRRKVVLAEPWDFSLRRHQDYEFTARILRYYRGCWKRSVTVNVDWGTPTRHKAHSDCFRVLDSFKESVAPDLYDRHIYTLCRSAMKSKDCAWLKYFPGIIRYIGKTMYRRYVEQKRLQ